MLSATPLEHGAFVAVDIETTGSRPGIHSIIEIGAVRIESGVEVATFGALCRAHDAIPSAITALTGISDEMVVDAETVPDVLARFREFAKGAVLVAHNHRFDLGFLDFESELATGEPFPRPIIDTLALANRLHPEEDRHNLRDLAGRYDTPTEPTHRAPADAAATAEVFLRMVPALLARGLRTAGDVSAFCGMGSQGVLARGLPLTTGLPDSMGVYVFRDAHGRVVHVGRAKNLRIKVRSYFYASGGGGRHALVGTTVSKVHWIPCASDLDALLLESRLITRYRPPHNATVLRGDKGGWCLHVDTTLRFPAVKVTDRPPARGTLVGPFTNRASLEAVAEQMRTSFGLRRCTWRMTSSLWSRPCEYRDDGTCPRPCVGDIDAAAYHERVAEALTVFSGTSSAWRAELVMRQEHAAASAAYEDAIRYRDAIRALDRCLSALDTIHAASEARGSVLIEATEEWAVLHVVRHGYLFRTLRLRRPEIAAQETARLIRRVLDRAYLLNGGETDPRRFTPRQLRDVFIIDSYRRQHPAVEVPVGEDLDATAASVMSAMRRLFRVPRRTHGAASGESGSRRPSRAPRPASR